MNLRIFISRRREESDHWDTAAVECEKEIYDEIRKRKEKNL